MCISMYTCIHKRIENSYSNTCTQTFVSILFTMLKRWRQPKCPSTKECINKWLYVIHGLHLHARVYDGKYSAVKRSEAMTQATTRMNMLGTRSQTPKIMYYMIPFMGNVQNRPVQKDEERISNCWELAGGMERSGRGSRVFIRGDEMFWNWTEVLVA